MSRALWVSGLVALGVATGCVDDGVSLHIICAAAPTISDNGCKWEANGEACVADGVVNIAAADSYRLNLIGESGLKPRARDVPPQAEPNGMQITGAKVEIRLPDGSPLGFPAIPDAGLEGGTENPFSVAASGYVLPGGKVVVPVTVLPGRYLAALGVRGVKQFLVAVQLVGKTNGNQTVESGEFIWPVRMIKQSPHEVDGECIPGVTVCLSSIGQDGFAQACVGSKP
ncbi:MAG TPA: hypothetical protein VI299_16925 [Polyangiales bacterium]